MNLKNFFIIVLVAISFLVTGCNKETQVDNVEEITTVSNNIKIKEDMEVKEIYHDYNDFVISLYSYSNGYLNKLNEIKENYNAKKDITVVQVYPSNEENIIITSTRLGVDCALRWLEIDPEHKIKQGFNISYELNDGTIINQTILNPSTTQDNYDYIEIYLYDAYVHRNDKWYSHIEESEMNDDTFFTSIKITAGSKINDIKSKITLTTFTYDSEDDFDEAGNYRGKSSYSITICDLSKTC